MRQNRELLLQAYSPERQRGQFPRSATFRWLASHLTRKAIISTLLSAAVLRPSWLRVVTSVLAARRGGRGRR
jgi:hypothetical protein